MGYVVRLAAVVAVVVYAAPMRVVAVVDDWVLEGNFANRLHEY